MFNSKYIINDCKKKLNKIAYLCEDRNKIKKLLKLLDEVEEDLMFTKITDLPKEVIDIILIKASDGGDFTNFINLCLVCKGFRDILYEKVLFSSYNKFFVFSKTIAYVEPRIDLYYRFRQDYLKIIMPKNKLNQKGEIDLWYYNIIYTNYFCTLGSELPYKKDKKEIKLNGKLVELLKDIKNIDLIRKWPSGALSDNIELAMIIEVNVDNHKKFIWGNCFAKSVQYYTSYNLCKSYYGKYYDAFNKQLQIEKEHGL